MAEKQNRSTIDYNAFFSLDQFKNSQFAAMKHGYELQELFQDTINLFNKLPPLTAREKFNFSNFEQHFERIINQLTRYDYQSLSRFEQFIYSYIRRTLVITVRRAIAEERAHFTQEQLTSWQHVLNNLQAI